MKTEATESGSAQSTPPAASSERPAAQAAANSNTTAPTATTTLTNPGRHSASADPAGHHTPNGPQPGSGMISPRAPSGRPS